MLVLLISVMDIGAQDVLSEKYPWLSSLIDFTTCSDGEVIEYDLGPYSYVVVRTASISALYFEDGSLFCTNSENFECATAYNLTSSDIGLSQMCENAPLVEPVCRVDTLSISSSEDFGDIRLNEIVLDLPSLVDSRGVFPISMAFSIAGFTYSVEDSSRFVPIKEFIPGVQVYDDVHYSFTYLGQTCEGVIKFKRSSTADLFEDAYSWLNDLLDVRSCEDGSVDVYTQGVHNYLDVNTPEISQFFYQSGNTLCTSSPTYDCVSAYGYDDVAPVISFVCGGEEDLIVGDADIAGVYKIDFVEIDGCDSIADVEIDLRSVSDDLRDADDTFCSDMGTLLGL